MYESDELICMRVSHSRNMHHAEGIPNPSLCVSSAIICIASCLHQGRRQDFQKGGSALSIEFRRCAHVNTCTRVNMCILINSFAIASRGT